MDRNVKNRQIDICDTSIITETNVINEAKTTWNTNKQSYQ